MSELDDKRAELRQVQEALMRHERSDQKGTDAWKREKTRLTQRQNRLQVKVTDLERKKGK
jgi:hypothetical protein